jgi:hypothetical protein
MLRAMKRPIRIIFYSPRWGCGLEEAEEHLEKLPARDLRSKVTNPDDPELMRMARLDCDWDGECLRAFAAMQHPELTFLPALIADTQGLLDFIKSGDFRGSVPWLIITDQNPALAEEIIGKLLGHFRRSGGKLLYWSYDEASRNMPCFSSEVAPHTSVLVHDEDPLAPEVLRALPRSCKTLHLSWVANVVPFAYPFREIVEEKIIFLGSRMGTTPHRRAQIDALKSHFKDRFSAITDHSVPVQDRGQFGSIKVHLCPEGRKFTTEGMRLTHTDRPFWSGCMGQVPVVEDSRWGGRLETFHERGVILRYRHDDVSSMIEACERALATDPGTRWRIYECFNREGTVGPIAASLIAAFYQPASAAKTPGHQAQ